MKTTTEHGHRAAASARECDGKWFDLNDEEMQDLTCLLLSYNGFTKHTIKVMTSWDSDRSDWVGWH